MKTMICIPTLNAGSISHRLLKALREQTRHIDDVLIIDSNSDDNTTEIFRNAGAKIHLIPRSSFNHGGTRQLAVDMSSDVDIIVFITQDAVLASPAALENLLASFVDEGVGAAYGRQLPNLDASPISAHARIYNYPSDSSLKTSADRGRLGIKAAFISNSFAAYRRSALMSVGGFPSRVIFGEDTYVAAKMILSGWKICYRADAAVYHSHNYNYIEEFRRYFDIGVFHAREKWFQESLGKAEGEGRKFVNSEFRYLLKNSPLNIPSSLVRTFFKYLGYKLGEIENRIPARIKKKLSMNRGFWQ